MGLEELKWERNSSLKDMMDHYNRLVAEMEAISRDLADLAGIVSNEYSEITDRFHELNDKILTVNYKTDEMKQDIVDRLDDILRRINANHPGN